MKGKSVRFQINIGLLIGMPMPVSKNYWIKMSRVWYYNFVYEFITREFKSCYFGKPLYGHCFTSARGGFNICLCKEFMGNKKEMGNSMFMD